MDYKLKHYLDTTAERINTPAFIADDPVQFPRRFSRLEDIEITSLLVSHIAWGNRKMICNNCERLLGFMQGEPYRWLMEQEYETLPDTQNLHRTFFASSLKHICRGLYYIYKEYGTLQNFAFRTGVHTEQESPWRLMKRINEVLCSQNGGVADCYCFPSDMNKTALKRFNMALRWLVRNDGIVDMGVWDVLSPSQLFIPLDVHVGNTARELGLLTVKSNDKYAVLHLTKTLRQMRPDDPCLYDFALFGIGIERKK